MQEVAQDFLTPGVDGGERGALQGQAQQGDEFLTVGVPELFAFPGQGFEHGAQGRGHLGQFGLDLLAGRGHAGGVAGFLRLGLDALALGHGLGDDGRRLGLGLGAHTLPELRLDLFEMQGRTARFQFRNRGLGLAAPARAEDDPAREHAGRVAVR
ncbi:hypothetical protein DSECCO2_500230 [anaerobic digester metagenome]